MKLKIISDGTSKGTKLIDVATSEAVECVQKIEWDVQADGVFTYATITVALPVVEITCPATISTHRLCAEDDWKIGNIVDVSSRTVKIVSTGTPPGTKITEANGEPISAVQDIRWVVDSTSEVARATVNKIEWRDSKVGQ